MGADWSLAIAVISLAGGALAFSWKAARTLGSLDQSVQHLVARLDHADGRVDEIVDALNSHKSETLAALAVQNSSLETIGTRLDSVDYRTSRIDDRVHELESGSCRS